jgi:DNA-directed RNA polymerase omega subunit
MESQGMENKFKFITVAAARCNQLQRGARPRVETRSHKNSTIAQEEVRQGLVEFRVPENVKQGAGSSVDTVIRGQDAG